MIKIYFAPDIMRNGLFHSILDEKLQRLACLDVRAVVTRTLANPL